MKHPYRRPAQSSGCLGSLLQILLVLICLPIILALAVVAILVGAMLFPFVIMFLILLAPKPRRLF